MSYPLTTVEILAKRRTRAVQYAKAALAELTEERQKIKEDYERVSAVYARHLERLTAKAARNATSMRNLKDHLDSVEEKYGLPQ